MSKIYINNNRQKQLNSSKTAYSFQAKQLSEQQSPSRSQQDQKYPLRSTQQIDHFSEISTSCNSEENNTEDFLDQMPQISNAFTSIMPSSKQLGISQAIAQPAKTSKQTSSIAIPEEAKYKTEMCKNWVDTGKCNYGEKCKFAHGKHQLVQKVSANKHFKTKPCKQFFEHSFCQYGSRCHFLHDVRTIQEIKSAHCSLKQPLNLEIFSEKQLQTAKSTTVNSFKRLDIFLRITSSDQSSTSA